MKIRNQLVLAFFLLAVLPLTALVVYNYLTSVATVRAAAEAEASVLTEEMNGRLAEIEDRLAARLRGFAGSFDDSLGYDRDMLGERLARQLGDDTAFVSGVRIDPTELEVEDLDAGEFDEFASSDFPDPPDYPDAPEAPESPRSPFGTVPRDDMGRLRDSLTIFVPESLGAAGDALGASADALDELGEIEGAEWLGLVGASGKILSKVSEFLDSPEIKAQIESEIAKGLAAADEEARVEMERALADMRRDLAREEQQSQAEKEMVRAQEAFEKRLEALNLDVAIERDGERIAKLQPLVDFDAVVDNVLASIPRRGDEIPFALDRDGELRVTDPADAERLAGLPLDPRSPDTDPSIECAPPERHETVLDEWVIVTAEDKNCGVVFGIAQPIGDTMTAVRQNAVRNAIAGIGLVALALIGILPISRRVSRDFETLTVHADRIAAGDLETPVSTDRSCREAAMLAGAFNRMAGDLATHQDQLVTQETERRLLEAEYSRKSAELEQARTFQLSLLPRTLPDHPAFEIAVHMSTAAEVGGDYYDFRTASDGSLVAAIGDATGHGARAGTMVTALKSLFSAWNVDTEPASFLRDAHQVVRRMDLGRMTMAFTLARLEPRTLFVASAGMPPVLIHREGQVDEVLLPGMPLGGLASDYRTERIDLQIGDVILLLSDGFPELVDCDGNVLGYEDVRLAFAAAAADGASASEIVDALAASVHEHTRGEDPGDDVTFVAVRIVS